MCKGYAFRSDLEIKNITKEVLEYIKNNWEKSIRPANDMVPYPFTSLSNTGHLSFQGRQGYF